MLAVLRPFSRLGEIILGGIDDFGQFVQFSLTTFYWILVHPRRWLRPRLLFPQFFAVGVASVPVVAITGAFIGMILALEGYIQFQAIGQLHCALPGPTSSHRREESQHIAAAHLAEQACFTRQVSHALTYGQ